MTTAGYMAVATSSASDDWPTPSWLVDQLATEFGAFDLDPAATAGNAKAARYYTEADDGLSQPWNVWATAEGDLCLCRCHLNYSRVQSAEPISQPTPGTFSPGLAVRADGHQPALTASELPTGHAVPPVRGKGMATGGKATASGNADAHVADPGSPKTQSTSPPKSRPGSPTTPGATPVSGSTPATGCGNGELTRSKLSESRTNVSGTGTARRGAPGDGSATSSTTLLSASGTPERLAPSPLRSGPGSASCLATAALTAAASRDSSKSITSSPSVRMTTPEPSSGTSCQLARNATSAKQTSGWNSGGQISCPGCVTCSPQPSVTLVNPPYGRTIGMWMGKARSEAASGNADRVVCLVPARVDTQWWRDSLAADPLVRIWPGRISFGDGNRRAPFASAIIVFGRLAGRHGTEPAFCAVCGGVYWPAYKSRKTCSGQCWKRLYRSGIRRPNLDAGEAS